MASSISLQTFQGTLLGSHFMGQSNLPRRPQKAFSLITKKKYSRLKHVESAKFDLFEIMGGRGLCKGEEGLQQELQRNNEEQASPPSAAQEDNSVMKATSATASVPENGFEKELMGLTGGFPGGEKGLQKFIEDNPPPKKQPDSGYLAGLTASKKPKAPELPLLMPGMIAIVKNPNNPFYMYCGIVQRITDGKAGVLFEGGNWDRLITFGLEELERRDKGPPGKNPKSAIIETLVETEAQ
uniref:NADPH-quinone oxidoreductase subunit Sic n=1 Tax=Rhizophora mucronata TaxID=61149 RepID=A0A2P2PI46_RHIMU